MTDKEFNDLKTKIQGCWDKWKHITGMHRWDVTQQYIRCAFEPDAVPSGPASELAVMADTVAVWERSIARVKYNMPAMLDTADEIIEGTVVRQIMLILTSPLRFPDKGGKSAEHGVTMLGNAMRWVFMGGIEQGMKMAKKKVDTKKEKG